MEMHGNVRHLVCAECHGTVEMSAPLARQLKAKQQVPCPREGCGNAAMRFKVMMYEDAEGEWVWWHGMAWHGHRGCWGAAEGSWPSASTCGACLMLRGWAGRR